MGDISGYPNDSTLSDGDKWLGTDSSDSTTKNFLLSDVKNYISEQNVKVAEVDITSAEAIALTPFTDGVLLATPSDSSKRIHVLQAAVIYTRGTTNYNRNIAWGFTVAEATPVNGSVDQEQYFFGYTTNLITSSNSGDAYANVVSTSLGTSSYNVPAYAGANLYAVQQSGVISGGDGGFKFIVSYIEI